MENQKRTRQIFVDKYWKTWSVQILIAANIIAGLSGFLPELNQILPENWYRIVFAIVLLARIIKQNYEK
jgi:hypothetical protein